MLGKLSVALLLVSASALAAPSSDEIKVDENGQAYRLKKVCQTYEVAGSMIPRRTCTNKKIPVKMPDPQSQEAASSNKSGAAEDASKAPQD